MDLRAAHRKLVDQAAMDVDKAQVQPGALDMHKAQIQPEAMDVDEAQFQETLNLAKLALEQAKSAWMVVCRKRKNRRGDSEERIRENWQDAKANVEDLEKRLYHIRGGNSCRPAKPKNIAKPKRAVQTRRTAKSSPSSLAASVIQNGISSISSLESSARTDTLAPVTPTLNDQEIRERQIETDDSSILVDDAEVIASQAKAKNISDDETDVLASQGAKILDHETVGAANGSAVSEHQVEADQNLLAVDGIKGITNEAEEAMKMSDDETRVPASKRDDTVNREK
ncbi:hypothetical protein GALMADRAFT_213515 [Galerina marginata CBS 339.88]|uniref:Uncharacterized protein n=1 Tax=Galerina marginata (strain CBS 339.88) TaxID=685588 RepID=A0A067SPV6_GALM3|nr:hypothetical protein GALMADRAFT_213515 [Galerina marginata CBS 339.88]